MNGAGERFETIFSGTEPERIDRFLARTLPLSRTRVVDLISAGRVLRNGRPPKKRDLLEPGDKLRVEVPPPEPSALLPESISLDIVHEDRDFLVVNKAAGMVVHPAGGHRAGTLVNALLHHVRDLSGIGGVLRPGIVHRLDKDTSGLMLVAKHDEAHRRLATDLKQRRIRRIYLAASWGHLQEEAMMVDAPIARDPRHRKRMAVVEGGKAAGTHLRREERWAQADLLRIRLETGRTHQIRVHLRHRGHPVVGDPIYAAGWERGFAATGSGWAEEMARRTPRLFLHATELRLRHPRTREPLRFDATLPPELEAVAAWARSTLPGAG